MGWAEPAIVHTNPVTVVLVAPVVVVVAVAVATAFAAAANTCVGAIAGAMCTAASRL
jgi:hypothetical protein